MDAVLARMYPYAYARPSGVTTIGLMSLRSMPTGSGGTSTRHGFSAPVASDRYATWRAEARTLCSGRRLTVRERAMVLRALWRDVCSR